MFEKNTKQVNQIIAKIFIVCVIAILFLVACSYLGVFEFGEQYTMIVLIAGLILTVSPSILIHFLPDDIMKYYMLIALSIFIGVLGTNNKIGVYITYILVPVFSCLYFEPALILRTSLFSYVVMAVAVYINSAAKYEVVYMNQSRVSIYIAYMLGFTIEYLIVSVVLYYLVKRAKNMMEERNIAKEDNRIKSEILSRMSHDMRTPMNAIVGMSEVAARQDINDNVRKCIDIIHTSSSELLVMVNDMLEVSDKDPELSDTSGVITNGYDFTTMNTNILLVDDNEINREVVKAMLKPLGIVIDEAVNGLEAVHKAVIKRYDLIFMDSHMPVMDGAEATRNIRMIDNSYNKKVPIIALTADAITGTKEKLIESGMNDYITKPIEITVICNIIKKYLPTNKLVVNDLYNKM